VIRESVILFRNISDACFTPRCNTPVRQQKDFVRTINLIAAVSCKNLWSPDGPNPGDLPAATNLSPRRLRLHRPVTAGSSLIYGTGRSSAVGSVNDIPQQLLRCELIVVFVPPCDRQRRFKQRQSELLIDSKTR
jgi:hypothetical protein